MNCRIIRPWPAPSAVRRAVSRRRLSPRARSRLATFAHAIRRHESDGCHQDPHLAPDISYVRVRQRLEPGHRLLLALQLGDPDGDSIQVRLGGSQRRAVRQLADRPATLGTASVLPAHALGVEAHRHEDVRVGGGEDELRRHHADHRERLAIQDQGPAERVRAAAEVALPEPVR